MKKQASNSLKLYIVNNWKLILLSVLISAVSYGWLVFSGNVRIDTEELINTPGTTLGWLMIGRYGLVALKRILGLSTQNYLLSGIEFFIFFVLGANGICYGAKKFGGERKYPYWVFMVLFCSSNIWCFQWYFSLQQAEIACAMFLLDLAAMWMCGMCFVGGNLSDRNDGTDLSQSGNPSKKRKAKFGKIFLGLISLIFMVIGFGSYQALVPYYIAVCIGFFLVIELDELQKRSQRKERISRDAQNVSKENEVGTSNIKGTFLGLVALIAHFLLAYGINSFIAKKWFTTTDYVSDQRGWGNIPTIQCIKNIINTVRYACLPNNAERFSAFPLAVILGLILIVLIIRKKNHGVFTVLAILALLASPFFMIVYSGQILVTRSQMVLPFVAAFMVMIGLGEIETSGDDETRIDWKSHALKISYNAVLIFLAAQLWLCLKLTRTDNTRYAHDLEYGQKILAELESTAGEEMNSKPVIFVGKESVSFENPSDKCEMFGWSFFEWDYSDSNVTGATHRIQGFLDAALDADLLLEVTMEEQAEAQEVEATMEAGQTVEVTDDIIVVRINRQTESLTNSTE